MTVCVCVLLYSVCMCIVVHACVHGHGYKCEHTDTLQIVCLNKSDLLTCGLHPGWIYTSLRVC